MSRSRVGVELPSCWALLLCVLLVSCSAQPLRIQTSFVPPGSLRLAQIMAFGKRDDVVQSKAMLSSIIASGVTDADIQDGSIALARIYCCGGMTDSLSSEKFNALALYVPKELGAKRGDIVELRAGRPSNNGDSGIANMATRVVQRLGEGQESCWWDPKNDRLWLRVLYCSWMPAEGWVKQDGNSPAWYKPDLSSAQR